MLKGIKIRIYPNKEQAQFISRQLGCCRFVYNKCLDLKSSDFKTSSSNLTNYIVALKEEFPFLSEVHSKVLQQASRDCSDAFARFFKERKKRKHPEYKKEALKKETKVIFDEKGYPNYKSKRDNEQSCRFPKDAFIGVRGNRIDLIRVLKDIHFKCSKKDEKYLNKRQDSIRSITLTKTSSDKYYLSILVDYRPEIKPISNKAIGLDLGIKDFIVDSNGIRYENKKFKEQQERKLKHLRRKLSKQKFVPTGKQVFSKKYNKMVDVTKPSRNYEKTRIRLAKLEEKIANQRYNYIQQLTTQIVNENQVICIEDLNVKGMMQNHKLAEHIQNSGFGEFRRVLEYKCAKYGRELIVIDRFYPSSKRCNNCGTINKNLKLSDREWVCEECGCVIDRDYNAALNILEEGLRIYENNMGLSSPSKPADCPTMDDKEEIPLKSSDRFVSQSKQEKNEFYIFQ